MSLPNYDAWLQRGAPDGAPGQVEDAYDDYLDSLEEGDDPMDFNDFYSAWEEDMEYEAIYQQAERRHPDARI